MRHKTFILILLFIVVAALALTIIGFRKAHIAEIYSKNELLYTIDLTSVDKAYEIPIERDGHTNTVLVEKNGISVISASCPDKLCVRQGVVTDGRYPIVCLPNNIYIKFTNSGDSSVDAISR